MSQQNAVTRSMRLLEIMRKIVTSKKGVTVKKLSFAVGVDVRTGQRYINELFDMGYVVKSEESYYYVATRKLVEFFRVEV